MKIYFPAVILISLITLIKISSSSPLPGPEPCFGFLLPLISGIFRALSFRGYGGPLGRGFMNSPGYVGFNPGMYYGAPYNPYYPPPQVVYPGGQVIYPGGQVIYPGGQVIYPGGQVIYPGGQVIYPGGQVIYPGGQPIIVNPGQPVIVNPVTTTTRRPILIG